MGCSLGCSTGLEQPQRTAGCQRDLLSCLHTCPAAPGSSLKTLPKSHFACGLNSFLFYLRGGKYLCKNCHLQLASSADSSQ